MGMGYGACTTNAFEYETVKELCPKEMAAIESHADFESWGSLAESLRDETTSEQLNKPVTDLLKAFYEATSVEGSGLTLYLTHYDKDAGDRYDETYDHDGCIFEVFGTTQLTPAGKKFKDKTQDVSYVVFC